MTMDVLKQLVKWFVLPPMGPIVVVYIGLFMTIWRKAAGLSVAFAGIIVLSLLATPAVSGLLILALDPPPVFDPTAARAARAIVILGGGVRRNAPEYGGPSLGSITLQRVRYGAHLARLTGLPILVSGGPARGAPPEAILMRNALNNEFGVRVRWIEGRSHNTHENARNSAAILMRNQISTVILVGHSFDFPRTRNEFSAAGIDAIPAPIDIPPTIPTEISDFVPSAYGLLQSYYACYEILANAVFENTQAFTGNSADTRSTPPTSSPLPRGS
jgi:uncharacterized SAM-binding protein YcdF (DUF218 family)